MGIEQDLEEPAVAVAFVKNDRQAGRLGDLELAQKAGFLVSSGRVHAVEIEPDFSPGPDPGAAGQLPQRIEGRRRAVAGVVGVNSHRGIELGPGFGQVDGLAGAGFH